MMHRNEPMEFKQPAWLFPRAVKLLALPLYRSPLLLGIVLSLGSKTEMGVSGQFCRSE